MRCYFLYCVEVLFNLPFLFLQKLESQMRDVAYGTKQYKAAPLEVIQYTEINKCIKTKMLLLKKWKNESLGCTSFYSRLVFTQDGVGVVFRSTDPCDPVKQGPHSKFLSGGGGEG